jgi:quercetin dioxygenase-like cupin family protein
VFWSHTVNVTSPAADTSLDTGLAELLAAGSSVVEPPGAHAVAARARAKDAARAPIVLVDLLICSPR